MECPYCKAEMKRGVIPMDGYVRWVEGESYDPFDTVGHETVRLCASELLTTSCAEAWYCAPCRVVIVPVKEFEGRMDAVKRKWNAFTDKMRDRRAASAAEREAAQRERRRAERGKKDPWEVD